MTHQVNGGFQTQIAQQPERLLSEGGLASTRSADLHQAQIPVFAVPQ
jgi:hypothetical protein